MSKKQKKSESTTSGYLYIIRMGNFTKYKIGKSYDSFNRLKQLQTGNPYRLLVLNAFYCDNIDDLEKIVHIQYASYRLTGEWFSFNDTVLSDCINFILKKICEINGSLTSKIVEELDFDTINEELDIDTINEELDIKNIKTETKKQHLKASTFNEADKYKCTKCSYSTNDKSNYNKHILSKSHKNVLQNLSDTKLAINEEYKCLKCNKTFSRNSSLKRHIKNFCKGQKNEDLKKLIVDNINLKIFKKTYENKLAELTEKKMD